ncbi:sarcosine oxidase subunit delta [Albimonas pacifica]|uniref:N-methylglutamate dehydrogenase subunit B n=1 Tax=Albimonas pacifica TaxID=1114924 RepID=A0A1I3DXZ7_9RHOB|nr:sarcosine oxidase subunit delta [Albimonas pacifica]SFH91479.1 N-methylglutamate dehydrogenase subunit B [Albimonas pacifica]
MRLTCPFCGPRDVAEFVYEGPFSGAPQTERPALSAAPAAWVEAVFLRDQPRGETRELWRHLHGCGCFLDVLRDTLTHEVRAVAFADPADAAAMRAKP